MAAHRSVRRPVDLDHVVLVHTHACSLPRVQDLALTHTHLVANEAAIVLTAPVASCGKEPVPATPQTDQSSTGHRYTSFVRMVLTEISLLLLVLFFFVSNPFKVESRNLQNNFF